MSLGTQINAYRKRMELTQDALAQKLGVTNQAVSKWEAEQCCPDVTLLPTIADVFGISLDELFEREAPAEKEQELRPDDTLRVCLFRGQTLVKDRELCGRVEIHWRGPVQNLRCDCNLTCDEVQGNVEAGGSVNCDEVQGNVYAGGNVNCDEVQGNVQAGGNVTCDDVQGGVAAGGSVTCDCIEGSVTAGREVHCE